MKKSKLLFAIALSGLLVACGGNNDQSVETSSPDETSSVTPNSSVEESLPDSSVEDPSSEEQSSEEQSSEEQSSEEESTPDVETFKFYISPVEGVSWPSYYVYTFSSAGGEKVKWPGEAMTMDSETNLYSFEVVKGQYDKVIFNDGKSDGAKQTKDLDYDYENPVFFMTSVNGAGQWGKIGDIFEPSEVYQWYLIGGMTSWAINDEYGMADQGDGTFKITKSFNTTDAFKIVAAAKGDNDWYGGDKLDAASKELVTVDTTDNNNMKMNTAGTYDVVWNPSTQVITITAAA